MFTKGPWIGDRPDADERKELFFDKFSPWENEQFITIYEFLLHRLSIAFIDVAAHDVLWGKHEIPYNQDLTPPFKNVFKEHCLSLGLSWLRRLAMADMYDARYQLLAPETSEQDPSFLYTMFDVYDYLKDRIMLDNVTENTVKQYIEPPFIEDPDPGPFTVWFWAHKRMSAAFTYANPELIPLRSEGYVMIEYDRLQKRYKLDSPFEPVVDPEANPGWRFDRAGEKEKESYRKRSEIYDSGGQGYWSEDGDSKLIWNVSAPGLGMEDTIDSRVAHYRDYWRDGILVDRLRFDLYFPF